MKDFLKGCDPNVDWAWLGRAPSNFHASPGSHPRGSEVKYANSTSGGAKRLLQFKLSFCRGLRKVLMCGSREVPRDERDTPGAWVCAGREARYSQTKDHSLLPAWMRVPKVRPQGTHSSLGADVLTDW